MRVTCVPRRQRHNTDGQRKFYHIVTRTIRFMSQRFVFANNVFLKMEVAVSTDKVVEFYPIGRLFT